MLIFPDVESSASSQRYPSCTFPLESTQPSKGWYPNRRLTLVPVVRMCSRSASSVLPRNPVLQSTSLCSVPRHLGTLSDVPKTFPLAPTVTDEHVIVSSD